MRDMAQSARQRGEFSVREKRAEIDDESRTEPSKFAVYDRGARTAIVIPAEILYRSSGNVGESTWDAGKTRTS
jgi:hypothetical protein